MASKVPNVPNKPNGPKVPNGTNKPIRPSKAGPPLPRPHRGDGTLPPTPPLTPKNNIAPLRRAYTIHLSQNHQPYVMHIDHNEDRGATSSSHIVTFRRKDEAMDVARLLQAHHNVSAKWPLASLSEGNAYQLLAPTDATGAEVEVEVPPKPMLLTVDHWFDAELKDYCNEHFLHQLWIANNEVEIVNLPVALNFARKQFRMQIGPQP